MKRVILIFAVVSAITGVASAQMLRPAAAPSLPPGAKAEAAPTKPEVAKPEPTKEAAKLDSTPARITPTLVVRQAPVPMQRTPRPPIAVKEMPPQEANAAETPLPETIRGISDANARAAIEADGYKRVRVISKSEDGTWRARAFRGSTEVALLVDSQGNVMAE
jgi:hypothetical protein